VKRVKATQGASSAVRIFSDLLEPAYLMARRVPVRGRESVWNRRV